MKSKERIRQSEIRVRSGIKLVLFLFLVAASLYLSGVLVLSRVIGTVALFFSVVTFLEYWNSWRLKRQNTAKPMK